MKRSIAALCFLSVVCLPASALFGDYVYSLVGYTGFDEAGWSIDGGSITTDETLGELAAGNIVAWSIEMTSTSNTFTLTNANSAVSLTAENMGLTASETELRMFPDGFDTGGELLSFISTSGIFAATYLAGDFNSVASIGLQDTGATPAFTGKVFGPNQSILIASRTATVPEPAGTLALVLLTGIAMTIRKRR